MKTFIVAAVIAGLFSSSALAFPALMTDPDSPLYKQAKAKGLFERDPHDILKRQIQGAGAAPLTPPIFDAAEQYVSNQGANKFVAPGPLDARGPCPGLNAMANHGYLPHDGVATIEEYITGTMNVFGMGADLATFLAVYGGLLDGTITSWSLEGGEHIGIGGSHGNYETDNSPAMPDLNQYGSNDKLVISQFTDLFNLQSDASTANYNLQVLREFRASRFQESIQKNPYFTYNPIGGILVSQAAYTFIYRFMANHSAANPEGVLNQAVLKSFYSITGSPGSFKWTKGHEAIPDNWYRRNSLDAYTIPYFNLDILYLAETVPQILEIGCNAGAVNTYDTLDVATLSGGAYTAADVASQPLCFVAAAIEAAGASLLGLPGSVTQPLQGAIANVSSALGTTCKTMPSPDFSALQGCPGFSLYGGPTGKVAPGAVQS